MKKTLLFLTLLIIGLGVVVGCSQPGGTSTTYYYPNWMPDGRIIACKEEVSLTTNLWGTGVSDYKYYITALTINSTNELVSEANLFEIDQRVAEIICSPTGEMIAYVANTSSNSDVVVTDYNGKVVKTPNIQANYLDWSPDATKIAYSYGGKLYVINIDGTNNSLISTEAGLVTWRYGDEIIYGYLSSIKYNGTNQNYIIDGGRPQKYSSAEVVYQGNDGVYVININGSSNTKLFSDYERTTLKLSFDNTKIVGGDHRSAGIINIYVVNIDGTEAKRLR